VRNILFLLALGLLVLGCGPTRDRGGDDDDDDSAANDDDASDDDDDKCLDDSFEPNDSFEDAWKANPGDPPVDLRVCPGNEDFLFVPPPNFIGGDYTLTVIFSEDEGDIDINLLDTSGVIVDSGEDVWGENETVEVTEENRGTVLQIQLYADFGDVPGTDYELMATPGG
jgi:hypothetical protein